MSVQVNDNTPRSASLSGSDSGLSDGERHEIARLGIGFDGRSYRYREYRYDRLSDAINYAEMESMKLGWRRTEVVPEWLKPNGPSKEEMRLMEQLGVTFDGRSYQFKTYRYDHCIDALRYAESNASDHAGNVL